MSEFTRLELLVELRRRGTLTAVAAAHSYSTSAVSQQLAALEREVGTPLLEPDGRRVKLTTQAHILAQHAETIIDRWERARADVAASLDQTAGLVRVAAFQTATAALVPPLAEWIAGTHPLVELQVAQHEPEVAVPSVLARDYDLAIAEWYPGQPPLRPEGLSEATLLSDPMRLATPHRKRPHPSARLRRQALDFRTGRLPRAQLGGRAVQTSWVRTTRGLRNTGCSCSRAICRAWAFLCAAARPHVVRCQAECRATSARTRPGAHHLYGCAHRCRESSAHRGGANRTR